MSKFLKLAAMALTAVIVTSAANASESNVAPVLVKGSKSYQSRTVSNTAEKKTEISATSSSPEQVEPAAGVETPEIKNDTAMKLQQQIKLPRKN